MRATIPWLRHRYLPWARRPFTTRVSGEDRSSIHSLTARARGIKTLAKQSREEVSAPFQAVFHACCLPHPAKVAVGGEDSYFACHATATFGVADGVGGWQDMGVNPAAFSRAIMRHSHEALQDGSGGDGADRLVGALHSSLKKTVASGVLGSSTAVLASFDAEERSVRCLNIGDSGVLIFRPSLRQTIKHEQILYPRIIYRSQRHITGFNCPLQLSHMDDPESIFGMPDVVSVQAKVDDIVVLCTDGVFDNLFDEQVQHIVSNYYVAKYSNTPMRATAAPTTEGEENEYEDEETLVREIAYQAREVSTKYREVTPFEVAAKEEGIKSVTGGKLDDTTVIVCSFRPCDDGHKGSQPTEKRVKEDTTEKLERTQLLTNFNDSC